MTKHLIVKRLLTNSKDVSVRISLPRGDVDRINAFTPARLNADVIPETVTFVRLYRQQKNT